MTILVDSSSFSRGNLNFLNTAVIIDILTSIEQGSSSQNDSHNPFAFSYHPYFTYLKSRK